MNPHFPHAISLICSLLKRKIFLVFAYSISSSFSALATNAADYNVLIVKSTKGFDGELVRAQLQLILEGVTTGNVHVAVTGPTDITTPALSEWYHDRLNNRDQRWRNLRGEDGKAWDFVVMMESPLVIESFPGWYAQGVHDVATEVERGSGEAVVLMQWPMAGSITNLDYYKEVSYRVGRGRDLKVIPAGSARNSIGGTTIQDDAYIAAASIYSRLWNKSAAESSYSYNDTMAASVFATMTANKGAPQYSGPFTSAPNTLYNISHNQNRVLRLMCTGWASRGWPTETINCTQSWDLMEKMGLINRITERERGGASSGLPRDGTPDDNGDLHFMSTKAGSEETTAKLVVYKTENYISKDTEYVPDYLFFSDHSGNPKVRVLSSSLMMAQVFSHYQSNSHVGKCHPVYASYMVTMMTGRCPIELGIDGTVDNVYQRIGYETAWRMSTLHGRAPGFKTWPSNRLATTVDPAQSVELKVAFALQPKKNVIVVVNTTIPDASVSPQTLTFTPENYNTPQPVLVSITKDLMGGTPFDVAFSTASEDIVYHELTQSWRYTVNRPPVADAISATVQVDQTSGIRLTGSDSDNVTNIYPKLQPADYSVAQQPRNGTVMIEGDLAAYTPNPGFVGKDSFTYKIKDFSAFSAAATVDLNVVQGSGEIYDVNLLVNPGAEFAPLNSWRWQGKWVSKQDTPSSSNALSGQSCFSGGPSSFNRAISESWQDVDVSNYADHIALGIQSFKLEGQAWCNGSSAEFRMEYRDAAGKVLDSWSETIIGKKWELYQTTRLAPANTAIVRVILWAKQNSNSSSIRANFDDLKLVALKAQ